MGARDRMHSVALLVAVALLATVSFVAQSPAYGCGRTRIGIAYEGAAIEGSQWNEMTAMGVARAARQFNLKVFEAYQVDKRGRPVDPVRNLSIGSCRNSSRLFGLLAC